jgi:uncharacterized membrane protein
VRGTRSREATAARSAAALALGAVLVAILAAGCGGGSGGKAAATSTAARTTTTRRHATKPHPPSALALRAQAIVHERCAPCHSLHPIEPGFSSAPKGIRFDTLAEIRALRWQIYSMAVASTTMPLGNATHMTDAERLALGRWFNATLG